MFKKFKDKLAEEVKSSPQRIQQIAQAAQAAVTSASSSISDITNNDLFSIGDNDNSSKSKCPPTNQQNSFQEVSLLVQQENVSTNMEKENQTYQEMNQESQRQRRLSNSSFASDISFRLPSYESPSMYHLQSDMEVSASEAEEKFSGSTVNLDRVTKDQLYAAYRRTQDRCTKYKTQYADLARHYKLLERENSKAKNVLVETQDKALRRISELREQCSLEQSAKAHLEKALRLDIEEKNMKIHTLNTKLSLLQNDLGTDSVDNIKVSNDNNDNDTPLINLAPDDINTENKTSDESIVSEVALLNNKIEKMEQLLNKYKDSLKTNKEKNAQLTTELQIISSELEVKVKENDQLKSVTVSLTDARQKILDLNEKIEELQNKNNSYEFIKNKELSILELNFKSAQDEIKELSNKIEVLSKREEEYAISLAENKLSIHKELESKETEIKSLKDSLESSRNEIQSLNKILNDYKNDISQLQEENAKIKNDIDNANIEIVKIEELRAEIASQAQKCSLLEQTKNKTDEEYNCLKLQFKQETAEKLAMIDRNVYLENRNSQILEENSKKNSQISRLEKELQLIKNEMNDLKHDGAGESENDKKYTEEITTWKSKCHSLESEIQEERVELVKLQSEIEKLLENYELVQKRSEQLSLTVEDLKAENNLLRNKLIQTDQIKKTCIDLRRKIGLLRKVLNVTLEESKSFKQFIATTLNALNEKIIIINITTSKEIALNEKMSEELRFKNTTLQDEVEKLINENKSLHIDLQEAHQEIDKLKKESNKINSENTIQLQKINKLKDEHQAATANLDILKERSNEFTKNLHEYELEKLKHVEHVGVLKRENDELLLTLKNAELEKESVNKELHKVSKEHNEVLKEINILTDKLAELSTLKENYQIKTNLILDLEKRIDELNEENTSLKKISDTISKSVTDIELELKEVRKSHSQIELEKEHLSSVINELENNVPKEKIVYAKFCQTDIDKFESNVSVKLNEKIQFLTDLNKELTEENERNKMDIDETKVLSIEHQELRDKYIILNEENKSLKSEIEGLQSYMTKVSKENGKLNDKLREIIASNENFSEKSEIIHDIDNLKTEIQLGKDKMEDLIRENSLLAEENLELKDQIMSQNYSKTHNKNESNNFNGENILEKYNNLIDNKNKLEKEFNDLLLANETVNINMQQVQSNNEKLRLSNEKLERRLDEALVSLRHLHSLQENTELEYLKNILYEYLTGTGTHSVTLAKVLSAVVKFDDSQTETVLQKEKERQGLLRQLGII